MVCHFADRDRSPRSLIRAAAVALFMMPALGGAADAAPLDDAHAADRRGDYATELRLLRPLAEQGNAEAQTALGFMYDAGHGVPQDYVEAVKWYRCAADQSFTDAQDSLARMYFNGWGVPKNYVQAHMWANLAASSFSGEGFNVEAGLRDNIAADMTSAQITEAQRRAREWRPKTPSDCQ
jgi:TPR repeat protein